MFPQENIPQDLIFFTTMDDMSRWPQAATSFTPQEWNQVTAVWVNAIASPVGRASAAPSGRRTKRTFRMVNVLAERSCLVLKERGSLFRRG
jgi:hypothetical protein